MMSNTPPRTKRTVAQILARGESGQAFVEFAVSAIVLILLTFGLIDFCRDIYMRQVLANLSREGANLAARGSGVTPLDIMSNAVDAVIASASPLDFNTHGRVIVTSVTNNRAGAFFIKQQVRKGPNGSVPSKVGTVVGGTATLPSVNPPLLQSNHTVYVAEVFYTFKPVTPIGKLIKHNLSTNLYDAAYFVAF